ncbi:type IV secretory system conjugative DNA transfer family protein [Sphingomonas sp. LK11]|uniref:type IV secretory system conjugative DNA transfer family protein n=1 Tax=Sphingomonas sp. LK11 TaxID=1390395 RepID=UPI001F021978|nr:type IV secretory system conjugative DNA transfer family protein [Sphingomonas sp. LK11]
MAGYGMQLWPILQDMHQLRATYGERAGTFMSNAGSSRRSGSTITPPPICSRARWATPPSNTPRSAPRARQPCLHGARSQSASGHVAARRLATPDEIMRMPPDSLLLLRQGEHPLVIGKIRYYDQREFAGLFDPV